MRQGLLRCKYTVGERELKWSVLKNFWSRKIYIEEPITSQRYCCSTPRWSINTIQETPNSQFRLVVSNAVYAQYK